MYHRTIRTGAVLTLILGLFVCRLTAADRAPAKRPAPTPPSAADRSLPDDRYVELGLASYDRTWTGREMTTAAARLDALASKNPEQLPRFGSPSSGRTFARLIAPENLDFFANKSLPLDARFGQALEYFQSFNGVMKLYLAAFVNGNKVDGGDLIELSGAQLRNCRMMLDLVDEFLPKIPKDDPQYAARMAGVDKMRSGLALVVIGSCETLTEERSFSVADRRKLVGFCRQTFPAIVPKLTAASQAEVVQRIAALAADERLADLNPALTSLRDEVRAATTPQKGK
jgi:hypothetical protein